MKSTKLSTIMFSIIIVLAMMLSIQNNAFSENWRDGFARISMLPQGVSGHQCFTANGFVYCAGGDTGSRTSQVRHATLNADGSLGIWQATTSLPYAVEKHQCLSTGNNTYCTGGYANSEIQDVLIHHNPFIIMPTHPKGCYFYNDKNKIYNYPLYMVSNFERLVTLKY